MSVTRPSLLTSSNVLNTEPYPAGGGHHTRHCCRTPKAYIHCCEPAPKGMPASLCPHTMCSPSAAIFTVNVHVCTADRNATPTRRRQTPRSKRLCKLI
jgi:hypothetical protein